MTSYHFRANIKMIPFRFGQLREDGWLHSKLYCVKAHSKSIYDLNAEGIPKRVKTRMKAFREGGALLNGHTLM